jgi:hypothetical protein
MGRRCGPARSSASGHEESATARQKLIRFFKPAFHRNFTQPFTFPFLDGRSPVMFTAYRRGHPNVRVSERLSEALDSREQC